MNTNMQLFFSSDIHTYDIECGFSPPSVRTTSVPPPSPKKTLQKVIETDTVRFNMMNNGSKGLRALGLVLGSFLSTIHDALNVSR